MAPAFFSHAVVFHFQVCLHLPRGNSEASRWNRNKESCFNLFHAPSDFLSFCRSRKKGSLAPNFHFLGVWCAKPVPEKKQNIRRKVLPFGCTKRRTKMPFSFLFRVSRIFCTLLCVVWRRNAKTPHAKTFLAFRRHIVQSRPIFNYSGKNLQFFLGVQADRTRKKEKKLDSIVILDKGMLFIHYGSRQNIKAKHFVKMQSLRKKRQKQKYSKDRTNASYKSRW